MHLKHGVVQVTLDDGTFSNFKMLEGIDSPINTTGARISPTTCPPGLTVIEAPGSSADVDPRSTPFTTSWLENVMSPTNFASVAINVSSFFFAILGTFLIHFISNATQCRAA